MDLEYLLNRAGIVPALPAIESYGTVIAKRYIEMRLLNAMTAHDGFSVIQEPFAETFAALALCHKKHIKSRIADNAEADRISRHTEQTHSRVLLFEAAAKIG